MRQRFKYDRETGEVLPAHIVEAKQAQANPSFFLLPDLDVAYNGGFESPIDGSFITSRSQLAEHNRRHDVIQAGDQHGKVKDQMKRHMRFNPEARGANDFSWVKRPGEGASRSGNLTEI